MALRGDQSRNMWVKINLSRPGKVSLPLNLMFLGKLLERTELHTEFHGSPTNGSAPTHGKKDRRGLLIHSFYVLHTERSIKKQIM
jgi:hypothetical protein